MNKAYDEFKTIQSNWEKKKSQWEKDQIDNNNNPSIGSYVRTKAHGRFKVGPIGTVVREIRVGAVLVEFDDFNGYGHLLLDLRSEGLEIVE